MLLLLLLLPRSTAAASTNCSRHAMQLADQRLFQRSGC
jgi:hypothetical protein